MSNVLAFDFGEVRVGVAVGSIGFGVAHPLEVISFRDNVRRFERIGALVEEWKPGMLVVGFPTCLDGQEHPLSGLVKKFSNRLFGRFGLPVEWADEYLTSISASQVLNQMGCRTYTQKKMLDAFAAVQILDTWFAARPKTSF